jgi:predicted nucleotidyltransferase
MTNIEIESIIKRVISKNINPDNVFVFLFGSRASGGARVSSDYDIGLYQGEKIPLSVVARIKDQLDDYPIPMDVDVVDFALATDEFKNLALRDIKIWNKPKKNLNLK